MYRIIILPIAQLDVKEAASWYDKQQKGLGKRFMSEVKQNIGLLKDNPLAFPNRYDSTRMLVLKIFPFIVYYDIDESKKVVVISAILHTSRHPDTWKRQ
jgi:plasmid stabilization system protein ParE